MGEKLQLSQGGGGGNFHQITCKFNGKRVGMLCDREAEGGRAAPLAPLSQHP